MVYTLEARRAFFDDFNGCRHRALQKVVNDQALFRNGPSDGYEMHPAIPTAKPRAHRYQTAQKRPRSASLWILGWTVRTDLGILTVTGLGGSCWDVDWSGLDPR